MAGNDPEFVAGLPLNRPGDRQGCLFHLGRLFAAESTGRARQSPLSRGPRHSAHPEEVHGKPGLYRDSPYPRCPITTSSFIMRTCIEACGCQLWLGHEPEIRSLRSRRGLHVARSVRSGTARQSARFIKKERGASKSARYPSFGSSAGGRSCADRSSNSSVQNSQILARSA